jgi:hypothetical protein
VIGNRVEGAQQGREKRGCHRPREEGFRYDERCRGEIQQSIVADADG